MLDDRMPWALIPVRALCSGKQRLATALTAEERFALNGQFLIHTIAIARDAGIKHLAVVTDGDDAIALASKFDVITIRQRSGDLNAAVALGYRQVCRFSKGGVLILPVDLAFAQGADIREITSRAAPNTAVICPDESQRGTNALFVPQRGAFAFHFGPDSFERHQNAARGAGLAVVTHRNDRVACDVDEPAMLSRLPFPFKHREPAPSLS